NIPAYVPTMTQLRYNERSRIEPAAGRAYRRSIIRASAVKWIADQIRTLLIISRAVTILVKGKDWRHGYTGSGSKNAGQLPASDQSPYKAAYIVSDLLPRTKRKIIDKVPGKAVPHVKIGETAI